jgi:peptidyl-prolyl cis-trans isomerase B (cyclophilin B)
MPTERQRREAERRRMQRQLQRRREREAARRKRNLIISIIGTLAIIGVVIGIIVATNGGGGSSDKTSKAGAGKTATSSSSSSSPSTSPSSASTSPAVKVAAYPCTWTKSGPIAKKVAVPSTTRPSRTGTIGVALHTNRGTIGLTLDRKAAPCAVESFVSLARQHYFDKTPCHRLTSGGLSVLQCGDPTGTGTGGPGYTFADELTGKEKYTRGVLAMANSGANTNGSQFFIVYKDSSLPPSYTIFGHVTSGLGVVDAVAAKGSSPAGDGKPKLPVTITQAVAQQ